MFDPSSLANPTPLAHADASRDVLPRRGTSQPYVANLPQTRPTNHCLFNTSRLYRIFAPCAAPPVLTSKNEKG
ncbi:hypothetical protein TNCV_4822211 [Trichonephila clavipes]|nr:hypothetical protein TNCV_4822211 [Trichonephila clavipes]